MNKTELPTDSFGEVVLLNTPEVRSAISLMLWNITLSEKRPLLSKIKICDKKHMLTIDGKDILYYDRHHHYPNKKDHLYAVFEYLKSVEDTLRIRLD